MSSVQIQQKQSNQQSFIITTAIFALLLITLLFIKLNHPPVEIPIESVVIDFGDGNEGAGNDLEREGGGQNSAPQTSPTPSPPAASTSTPVSTPTRTNTPTASNTMTAEDAQAIAIAKMQKAEAEAKAREEKRLADIIKKAEAERLAREAEEKRIKDQMAGVFSKGKTGTGNGTGNGTGTGTGSGNGTGNGSGNGSGNGNGSGGNGTGSGGSGVGTGLNVTGRGWKKRVQPFNSTNKEGKVVVAIKVDKAGNIIYAKGGYTGSTTTDAYLVKLAEDAARNSTLTSSDASSEEQFGTIVYNFRNSE
jgi:outer membrane biosynthesis protein TonB